MKKMKENILITGGNGFLGSYLVKILQKKGIQVTISSRSDLPKDKVNNSVISKEVTEITAEDLRPYSVIIHLAGITTQNSKDNEEMRIKNVEMVQHLLNNLASNKREVKFIFASSAAVYGFSSEKKFREEDTLNPQNNYARAKVEGEILIHKFAAKFPFLSNYLILRFANIYGPGQRLGFFIPDTIDKIRRCLVNPKTETKEITIYDGDSVRDFVYIDDVADAMLELIIKKKRGIFNIGGGKPQSLSTIASQLVRLSDHKMNINYVNREISQNILDINKIIQETNWKPKMDIGLGLRKVWENE